MTKTKTAQTTLFSEQEKAAMRERAKELVAEGKAARKKEDGTKLALDAISAMVEPDRSIAFKIHEIVTAQAPDLWPKTWYGMPAYARDGKVVCFFQSGAKFESRYCTLGFSDTAKLDKDGMWATSFAIARLGPSEEAKVVELLKTALG